MERVAISIPCTQGDRFRAYADQLPEPYRSAPELLAVAQAAVDRLELYIDNPSAWDSYSENVSEQIGRVRALAVAAIARATGTED